MIKRKGLKQFKCLKATMMSSGMQEKRTKRARALEDRIRRGCSIEKCVWLDEKYFTLDISLNSQNSHAYGFENKDNIQDNLLFHQSNACERGKVLWSRFLWKMKVWTSITKFIDKKLGKRASSQSQSYYE